MKRIMLIFLSLFLLTSCSNLKSVDSQENLSKEELLNKISELKRKTEELEIKANEYENKINDLTNINSKIKSVNESLKSEIQEYKQSIDVYKLGYSDKSKNSLKRVMFVSKGFLKTHPYNEALNVIELEKSKILIHNEFKNEQGQNWAFVEIIDSIDKFKRYGFVNVDGLEEIEIHTYKKVLDESINSIHLGDSAEVIKEVFGSNFEIVKGGMRWLYKFENESLILEIDPISNTITSINVNEGDYSLESGVKIGNNAIEAISKYKDRYEVFYDYRIFDKKPDNLFHFGEGYVLYLGYDTETLGKNSIITRINLYSFYDIEW